MRSAFRVLLSSTVLVAALAACGGGGGGGTFTPPTTPGPTTTPVAKSFTLTARCGGGNCSTAVTHKTSARFRDLASALRSPRDATPSPSPTPTPVLNTGSIPQFVLFSTPDTYTHGSAPISNYGFTLFAYLDTSNGSVAPSPLPAVSWSKNGPSLVDSVVDPTTIAGVPANTLKPGYMIQGPSTPGQTIYEASAIGQYAPFYVNTYYALGVSSDPNDAHGYNNCLQFNLAGIAVQNTSGNGVCDVSIDGAGIHVGTAGVFLPTTNMPIQSDSTGYTAQQTVLPLDYNMMITLTASGANISYLAHLADGRYAMLYVQSLATVPGGTAGHEQIQVVFAPYKVSDSAGHFAY